MFFLYIAHNSTDAPRLSRTFGKGFVALSLQLKYELAESS